MRQGQTFYSSAVKLHHRASPLFYYYAFLNLAKACISLRTPDVFSFSLNHGISHHYDPGTDFASQTINSRSTGVFPSLYELLTEIALPRECSFNVANLLGYLTDITFEYQEAGFGTPSMAPVKSRLFVNQLDENTFDGWAVVAVGQKEKLAGRTYALTRFFDYFEEVELGKADCERMFQLSPPDRQTYRFFQGKTVYHVDDATNSFKELHSDVRKAVSLLFMPSVFHEEGDFYFSFPLADKPELPMDEFLAGYLLFFYLGSLVRYHPDYLEQILRSKEAWIIQRFTSSCAVTLPRRISIFLLQQNRVFCAR